MPTGILARFTVQDVMAMADAGLLADRRIELDDGVLLEMEPTGPDHKYPTGRLIRHIAAGLPAGWLVFMQDSAWIPDGFLSPDLYVVPESAEDPDVTDMAWVIEVAVASHARDREKTAHYARAGVPEYWIVDALAREVVVHTEPLGDGYRVILRHGGDATLAAPLGVPDVRVGDLLR